MDLITEPLPGLRLSDPFMIASSHWTSSEAAFRQLAPIRPSAITLKTMSGAKGAAGEGSRDKQILVDSYGKPFAGYTDGPKTAELWDAATTYRMTQAAKRMLPGTVIGLSILSGENYEQVARQLEPREYGYVELNWKYSFRGLDMARPDAEIGRIQEDLSSFLKAFLGRPLLIKVSRE